MAQVGTSVTCGARHAYHVDNANICSGWLPVNQAVSVTRKFMPDTQQMVPGTRRHAQYGIYELARSIEERDRLTYDHCRRVAIYANRLARALGWKRSAARDLALAGLAHDLGKTWIGNSVLHKDSALSLDERLEMQ